MSAGAGLRYSLLKKKPHPLTTRDPSISQVPLLVLVGWASGPFNYFEEEAPGLDSLYEPLTMVNLMGETRNWKMPRWLVAALGTVLVMAFLKLAQDGLVQV